MNTLSPNRVLDDPGPDIPRGDAAEDIVSQTPTPLTASPTELTQQQYTEMKLRAALEGVNAAERDLFATDEEGGLAEQKAALITSVQGAAAALVRFVVTHFSKEDGGMRSSPEDLINFEKQGVVVSSRSIMAIQRIAIASLGKALAMAGGNGVMKGVAFDTKEHNERLSASQAEGSGI